MSLLKLFGAIFLIIIFIFCSFIIYHLMIYVFKYKKRIKIRYSFKRKGKLRRLFVDLPKAIARDIINFDPDEFRITGLRCFCGEQGSGKTSALVDKIRELKKRYPKVKVLSNFDCDLSDGLITDWRDIVFTNNGKEGIIIAIDELQNWFSTNESKDFPPEMLQEITQQRKQRKMILATSQRFQRLAKPLREQIQFLYEPFTIGGVITFVRQRKPFVDDDGKLDRNRTGKRGTYFFVHDDELRNSYDTFQKIERQANGGYRQSPFAKEPPVQNIDIDVSAPKRKL